MTPNDLSMNQLEVIASKIRQEVVRMSHDSKTPHLGSSLSIVDILTAVYWTCLSKCNYTTIPNISQSIINKNFNCMCTGSKVNTITNKCDIFSLERSYKTYT